MPKSFVLMTALPPTKGHLDLIKYAHALTDEVVVIVCSQPDEPFAGERYVALMRATEKMNGVRVKSLHETLPQEPDQMDGFWDMWRDKLHGYGFMPGDFIVSSELYGIELAKAVEGVFMPYDLDRFVNSAKATWVRDNPVMNQHFILPEFMRNLRRTVTIFGAESVGKTTVTNLLGPWLKALTLPEWARPYLEAVGPEVTTERMHRIHEGQKALQIVGEQSDQSIYVIQDTDLYSTVGYWEMWDKPSMPASLLEDAKKHRSHLYVILSSDLPFEPDPLRYGGDQRESSDIYWIDLCEREGLPYRYITDTKDRAKAAQLAIEEFFWNPLNYKRSGHEYERNV